MINLVELNKIIDERNVSVEFLARSLGRSGQGIRNKLDGTNQFTALEINKLSKILLLTDEQKLKIFFA